MCLPCVRTSLLAAVLLVCRLSPAQQSGFGFKAGPTFSTFNSSAAAYTYISGYTAGFWRCRWLSDDWSVQAELTYTRLGAKRVLDAYTILPVKLNYVRLPVLLKFNASPAWSLHFGPDPGFLLKGRKTIGENSENIAPQMRRFDLAFAMGTGLELANGWDLSARYSYGLSQLMKEATTDFPCNRSLQIALGYTWVSYIHRARQRCHKSGSGGSRYHSRLQLL